MPTSSTRRAVGRFQADHTSTDGSAFMLILMRTINQWREARGINTIFCSAHSSRIVPAASRYLHTRLPAEAIRPEALGQQQGLRQLSAEESTGTMTLFSRFVWAS